MLDNLKTAVLRLREKSVEVSEADDARFSRSLDHTRYSVLPAAVVFAKSADDVAEVLRVANELRVGVTVRGSGTGCAGGAVPVDGGLVLDMSGLDSIEIDPVARVATVGAGAITAAVDAAANKYGLFYAPDPSSHKYCSVGGNIACNAGGLRAFKYGLTRDNVLSLTAFSASGKLLQCGLPLRKFSAGLNLRDLFIGSEGILGVVVQAKLKLLPLPDAFKTMAVFFDDDFAAFEGVGAIMRAGISPCILEFMDADTIACVSKKFPELRVPCGKSALLVEFDGTAGEVDASARKCAALFADVRLAEDEQRRQEVWKIRRAASSSMYLLADTKINQDIVLPNSALREFFRYYKKLGAESGLPCPVFGHSGDGNYHIHFMFNAADTEAKKRAQNAMDLSIKKAIALGGAVSGEHGIGFLKSKYMPLQHSAAEIEYMRAIKKLFDPNNILNRDKVVVCSDLRERLSPLKNIKLPWD